MSDPVPPREAMSADYVMGIDLGGTSIKAVAVTPARQTLFQIIEPFVDADLEWARKIQIIAARMQLECGHRARALGLSAPGLTARDERSIAFMPGRLFGLEGLNWTSYLHWPEPIPVLNDAQAALLGEVWHGAAKGRSNVFLLTLGTGVGGAAMVDGHLLRGHLGRAGHLGHSTLDWRGPRDCCQMPGSLEWHLGNKTIVERSGGLFNTTFQLVEAHLAGNADASRIWLESVQALACGVASFVNVLDPEMVIIGGGIARAGPALFEPLEQFLADSEWRPGGARVKVVPAELGELAGAYGAASRALHAGEGSRRE